MLEHRQYMIFNISELSNINFTEVLETSTETVRFSLDGTKTFVKWDSESEPECMASITTKEGPYTYSEILEILSTSTWSQISEEF
jgi:hypothetical protein